MSRESNPKFQKTLVDALTIEWASQYLLQSASIFVAEHLDTFAEWLDAFLQYLTVGGKDVTTGEDAELAAVVVEKLKEENVDPLDNVEQPGEDAVSDTDPLDNVKQPEGHADSQPASEDAPVSEDAVADADSEDEDAE